MQRTHYYQYGFGLIVLSIFLLHTGCSLADTSGPDGPADDSSTVGVSEDGEARTSGDLTTRQQGLHGDLDAQVRTLMDYHGVEEPETIDPVDPAVFELGEKLFFDKALSGNKDVACATCHFTTYDAATSDGLSLGIGVGGVGSIPDRKLGPGKEHEPRNSIELFNRGIKGWETQFWDARVQLGPNGEFVTPAGEDLQEGLVGLLGAQAMFPVTSRIEMRGESDDPNPISQVPDGDFEGIWSAIMDRLLSIPGYRALFKKAYPNKKISELKFADAANAIGLWEREAYTFLDAPFDQYLKGDDGALTKEEKEGAKIFYGKGDCASCHSGTLTTDQEFHNIAAPQIGPGKGSTKPLDPGRFLVTGQEEHKFEFRTPPLRNIELTGPYMHSGAYHSLEKAIEHHLDPERALQKYDGSQLRSDFQAELHNSSSVQTRLLSSLDWRLQVRAYIQREPWHSLKITDDDVDKLVAFLKAMTSPQAEQNLMDTAPSSVPSGLLEDGS